MLTLNGHSGAVTALAYSPAGRWLASAGWDGTVRLWDVPTASEHASARTANPHTRCVAWSPDGRFLAAGFQKAPAGHEPSLMLWSIGAEGDPVADWGRYPLPDLHRAAASPHGSLTRAIAFAPDGRNLVTAGGRDGWAHGLQLPNLVSHSTLFYANDDRAGSVALAYRPDGRALASIGQLGSLCVVTLFDTATGKPNRRRWKRPDTRGHALAFSPDGRFLAAGVGSNVVLWEDGTARWVGDLASHEDDVLAVAFAPDGRTLASAGRDGLVIWWDLPSMLARSRFDWGIGDVSCVAFAPDGLTAAAGGHGGEVVLWDFDG